MQLVDRIKDFIEANKSSGMSQNKFATALGINPAYISGYIK
ncbi:MAG: helix-turn-helix transcriptional regulator, partial [Campylobacter sp.]|nr:helix-turn-helix transcriptional regulator [Campylobacter sp.]